MFPDLNPGSLLNIKYPRISGISAPLGQVSSIQHQVSSAQQHPIHLDAPFPAKEEINRLMLQLLRQHRPVFHEIAVKFEAACQVVADVTGTGLFDIALQIISVKGVSAFFNN